MMIRFKKLKSGKFLKFHREPQREISSIQASKISWIIMWFFLIHSINVYTQVTLCENIGFERGSSVMTKKMKDTLDQLCKKTCSTKRGRIALTVWQNKEKVSMPNITLAESRMRKVFAYLISKNCGNLVKEIRIKPMEIDSLTITGMPPQDNQIEFCILESFPDEMENDSILDKIQMMIPGLVVSEPDTIIQGPNGTLVKFHSGSFEPYKLSDFRYDIDEMFTAEAIGNNNMSTMTSSGALITSFKALRIWATPVNSEIPVPAALHVQATILIPVDSTMDNPSTENILAFMPGKGGKPFVTWNKSGDSLSVEIYGGRKYIMLQTQAMGYLAIGKMNQSGKTFFVEIPRFRKIKITVTSGSNHALAIFTDPGQRIIRLTPGDSSPDRLKDFFISVEGVDHSGNVYVLKQTILERFASKKKRDYFVLRKKNFVKI